MTEAHRFTPSALLAGRRAVVSGGATGIGAAIVAAFASHGAHVLVVDNAPAPHSDFDGDAGGAITTLDWDVCTSPCPAEVVDHRPDILVNNVGHFLHAQQPFTDNAASLWNGLHEINFAHVLPLTQSLLPGMVQRGGASIINLTTVEAHRAIPGQAVYSAYKAALTQFTSSLAAEVGPSGVRVNAVAPDLIESAQVPYADLVPRDDARLWPNWSPLGGPGQPEDVAGAALFLASDLSRFVTGGTIHVDGGTHASGGWVPRGSGWTNRPRNP